MPRFSLSDKYVKNLLWLLFDYSLRLVGGYFIAIWLARELGPKYYGIYNYAIANASILAAIAVAGLQGVAIKFLVENKEEHHTYMGTIFWIRIMAAFISYVFLFAYLFFNEPTLSTKAILSLFIGLKVFFTPLSVVELYFESIVKSKFKVISRNIAYAIRSVLIVLFIVLEWPFLALGFIVLIEELLGVFWLLFYYKKDKKSVLKWQFNLGFAKAMMHEAWPMVISSAGAILYMKIDQVMVVELLSEKEGGYYSAAVKISELFSFIPGLIVGTFFPAIIESKMKNEIDYKSKMRKLILLMLTIAGILGLGIYLFAYEFVFYSFGEDYISSVSIIRIHIWTLLLTFTAAVLSRWLIVEKLTRFSILRHSIGVVINIVLNFLLIPKFGGEGAAYASIVSLLFAVVIFTVFDKRTFSFLQLLLSSLFIIPLIKKR